MTDNRIVQSMVVLFIAMALAATAQAGDFRARAASPAQKKLLQEILGSKHPITDTCVVKSPYHKQAWYVGAAFYASGVGEVVGVWTLSGPYDSPSYMVLSIDEAAFQFSRMGKACRTKAKMCPNDPEARFVKKCAGE